MAHAVMAPAIAAQRVTRAVMAAASRRHSR
jgi:hypothetical protein